MLIFIFILLMNFSANSQQFITQKITSSDLPGRTIYGINQDPENNIWVASDNGIAYFDGLKWHQKRKCPGYLANVYHVVKFDKHGKLWAVGYFKDIVLVSLKNQDLYLEAKYQLPEALQKKIIDFSFLYDRNDSTIPVILVKDFGVLIYKNKSWIKLGVSKELPSLRFYSLTNKNNHLYIVHSKGISKLDASLKLSSNQFAGIIKGKNVRGIFVDNNEKIKWFVDKKNLYSVTGNSLKKIYTLKGSNYFERASIVNYFMDEYVVSANRQIIFFNQNGNVEYIIDGSNGLYDATINDLFLDCEKVLWIASYRGIAKLVHLDFVFYNKSDGLVNSDIASIEQMNDSLFFLGSREGYSIFNAQDHSFKNYKPEILKGARITDCLNVDGEIWIAGEESGLLKLTSNGKLEIVFPTSISHNTVSICEDDKGGI
ncbi:MAG: hypothetical protein D6830_03100, partial [Ignavibacteria bacterium]